MILHVLVGFGRTFVIVEGHAGRNDIEHHSATVSNRRLHHAVQLLFVAGERTSHKSRA